METMSYFKKYRCAAVSLVVFVAAFLLGCFYARSHDAGNGSSIFSSYGSDARDARIQKFLVNDPSNWINPFVESSPMHREFDAFTTWILNNDKLKKAGGSAEPAALLELSNKLKTKGIARLQTSALEQRISAVSKILPSFDSRMCSSLLRGGFSAADFITQGSATMESFSEQEAKDWYDFNRAAIEAELDRSPIIVLSIEDATRGMMAIAKSMYATQSRSFITGMASLKTASDAETCAIVRTLYTRGNALPEPYRGYMARFLLTGKEGNEAI